MIRKERAGRPLAFLVLYIYNSFQLQVLFEQLCTVMTITASEFDGQAIETSSSQSYMHTETVQFS